MANEPHILLLTGRPALRRAVLRRVGEILDGWRIRGFYTEEIRDNGTARGFRSVAFGADVEAVIGDAGRPMQPRVDGYGVDVAAIDELAEATLRIDEGETDAVLVAEIGTMQCLSSEFLDSVTDLFDASVPLVATVPPEGRGLMAEAMNRPDALVWEATPDNQERLAAEVVAWLQDRRRDQG
jgi:nucleoside-triphosphatase THEP1